MAPRGRLLTGAAIRLRALVQAQVMCVNETGDGLVDRDYGRTT